MGACVSNDGSGTLGAGIGNGSGNGAGNQGGKGPKRQSVIEREQNAAASKIQNLWMKKLTAQEKEGYLTKEGSSWKTWNKRFFQIKGGILSYYESEQNMESAKGSYDLSGCALLTTEGCNIIIRDTNNNDKCLKMKAETEDEAKAWKDAIESNCGVKIELPAEDNAVATQGATV